MSTLSVPSRFNGPPASGNGGYSCGVVAARFDGTCAVSLRRPVPLDQPLELEAANGLGSGIAGDDDGADTLRVTARGELIAEAVAAPELAPWSAPAIDLEAARDATSRFVPPANGFFDRCFVCGRDRHDGFCVFAGPVADEAIVASTWTPPAWAADEDGAVRPEFVWAVLDCPGYFALHGGDGSLAFLARQQSTIRIPPRAGVEYVVVGVPLERSGRKGLAKTAVIDAAGEVLAHAEMVVVEPRPEAMSHKGG
ncbi:MAG TPA: hypothetical protein VHS74_18755 [Solirubrobacterales bacterium]|nr:hypothetical protein [Solirubrobacterales bacterium]